MNNPAIIITGANGFIGAELVNYFTERQYPVFALCRTKPAKLPAGAAFVKYDLLDEDINEEVIGKVDIIIHCAYAKYSKEQKDADKINIEGTKRLLEFSRKFNIKKFIFLSSFSAHHDAISHYGKTKFQIENSFDTEKDLILKPGLVLGNGGFFNDIKNVILKNKFIPLLAGGKQPVQTIHINELAFIIQKGIEKDISGIYAVAEPEAIRMKTLYKVIFANLGREKVYINIPYWSADLLIFLVDIFHVKIPVSKENIRGLKKSIVYDISDTIARFNFKPANYIDTLNKIWLK
ncbi:MAG: NAD-dependent epimerase/dehydratase family protein [Bacteroidales bacterium]|jgi:nucleoside-diphosphate-sugar epimerase